MATEPASLEAFIGRQIILDTAGPVCYLGTLEAIRPEGFWLREADIRDRTEGHVSKERYAVEAATHGIRANRRRIFVFRDVVISCSALEDIVVD